MDKVLVGAITVASLAYVVLPSSLGLEVIPDALPYVGHVDETVAFVIAWSGLHYLRVLNSDAIWKALLSNKVFDVLLIALAAFSVLYLAKGTGLELIPDHLPFIGELDEAFAVLVVFLCLEHFNFLALSRLFSLSVPKLLVGAATMSSLAYVVLPSMGVEFIPDELPFVGHVDEAVALVVAWSGLQFLNIVDFQGIGRFTRAHKKFFDVLLSVLGLAGVVYLAKGSDFELIPDHLPLIGEMDETLATLFLFLFLQHFHLIDISQMFALFLQYEKNVFAISGVDKTQ